MTLNEVKGSSSISHLGYDPQTKVCTVKFHSGTRYTYEPMSQDEFNRFASAPSVGKYFAQNVRDSNYKVTPLGFEEESATVTA